MKKLLSVILVIAMLISALAVFMTPVVADGEETEPNEPVLTYAHVSGEGNGNGEYTNISIEESNQQDTLHTVVGNFELITFYYNGEPLSPNSIKYEEKVEGELKKASDAITIGDSFTYTDDDKTYTIYPIDTNALIPEGRVGSFKVKFDGDKVKQLPVEVDLPFVGLYKANEATKANYLGNTVEYDGTKQTYYAIIAPERVEKTWIFASENTIKIVDEHNMSVDDVISFEKISDIVYEITLKENQSIDGNNANCRIQFNLVKSNDSKKTNDYRLKLEIINKAPHLVVCFKRSNGDALGDGNKSTELSIRRFSEEVVSFKYGVGNDLEALEGYDISFSPKTGNSDDNASVSVYKIGKGFKGSSEDLYWIRVNGNVSGVINLTKEGSPSYSIPLTIDTDNILFYEDGALTKEVDERGLLNNLDNKDGTVFFAILASKFREAGYEIEDYSVETEEGEDNIISEAKAVIEDEKIIGYKLKIDESKIKDSSTFVHIHFDVKRGSLEQGFGSTLRIYTPQFYPEELEGWALGEKLVEEHEATESDKFDYSLNREGNERNFGNNGFEFEYNGTKYYLKPANYDNTWGAFWNMGGTTDYRTFFTIFAPGIFKSSGDGSLQPASNSEVSELLNHFDFGFTMYAGVNVSNGNDAHRIPAQYTIKNPTSGWQQIARIAKFDPINLSGQYIVVVSIKEKGSNEILGEAMSTYGVALMDVAEKIYISSTDVKELNDALKEVSEKYTETKRNGSVDIYLPAGEIEGDIVLPKGIELGSIFVRGTSPFHDSNRLTTIKGSVTNKAYAQLHFDEINFVGKGKDNENSIAVKGINADHSDWGQVVFTYCDVSNYYTVFQGLANTCWGSARTTFHDNHIVYNLNYSNFAGSGDKMISDCTFIDNDIVMWFENFNDGDLYELRCSETRFINNGIDVVNRSGRMFWITKCFFYHGDVDSTNMPTTVYSLENEAHFLPRIHGATDAGVPLTLISVLSKNYDCTQFFSPTGKDDNGETLAAFLIPWDKASDRLEPGADAIVDDSSWDYLITNKDKKEKKNPWAVPHENIKLYLSPNSGNVPTDSVGEGFDGIITDNNGTIMGAWDGFDGKGNTKPNNPGKGNGKAN